LGANSHNQEISAPAFLFKGLEVIID